MLQVRIHLRDSFLFQIDGVRNRGKRQTPTSDRLQEPRLPDFGLRAKCEDLFPLLGKVLPILQTLKPFADGDDPLLKGLPGEDVLARDIEDSLVHQIRPIVGRMRTVVTLLGGRTCVVGVIESSALLRVQAEAAFATT